MSIAESFLVALIVMSIVFVVLIALSLLVKVQSVIFSSINKSKESENIKGQTINKIDQEQKPVEISTGELKLIGVDERTTAMIMAILSDELKIPLSELQFKTIRALD